MEENKQVIELRTELSKVLHHLVAEQTEELAGKPLKFESAASRKDLFRDFKKREAFKKLYGKALEYHLLPHTDQELKEFRRRFAGKLFQEIVYTYLAERQFPYGVLLSPERTLEFYSRLYPTKPRIKKILGLDSLIDKYVPDGLLIEGFGDVEKIVILFEYTLTGDRLSFESTYKGFNKSKKDSLDFFTEASLTFVTPENSESPTRFTNDKHIYTYEMPFSRKQFRDFIDSLYYKQIKDHYGYVTLNDIQARAREQLKRGEVYAEDGNLMTPEYRQYTSRVKKA